jgi:hypothetical protein
MNCKIVMSPSDGSLFIRTSKNCEVSAVCKQLRFRDCHNIKIFAFCPSDPVVETSSLISFAPFNYSLPNLKYLFEKASFSICENKYKSVYDFSDGKKINDAPHWLILETEEFINSLSHLQITESGSCETQLNKESINQDDMLYTNYMDEFFSLIQTRNENPETQSHKEDIPVKPSEDIIGNSRQNLNNDLNTDAGVTNGVNFEQGADLLSSNKSSPQTASNKTVGSSDFIVVEKYNDKINNDNFLEISKVQNDKPTNLNNNNNFIHENFYGIPQPQTDQEDNYYYPNYKEIFEKERLIKLKNLMEEELKNKSQLINNARDFIERFERY